MATLHSAFIMLKVCEKRLKTVIIEKTYCSIAGFIKKKNAFVNTADNVRPNKKSLQPFHIPTTVVVIVVRLLLMT